MHILLIADGRSPITRRWIEAIRPLGHRISLLSSYPCDPPDRLEDFAVLPLAFGQFAAPRSSAPLSPARASKGSRPRLFTSFNPVFRSARDLFGPLSVRAAASRYRRLLAEIQPDLVHALRVPFEGMLASYTPDSIPLAVSIWGNDLTLHAPASPGMRRLTRQTLERADGLLTDVQRDQRLARAWGFPAGRPAEVVPGNGGLDLTALRQEIQPLPPELEALLPPDLPLAINPRGLRAYARTDTFFRSIPLILERRPELGFVCPGMQNQPQATAWLNRLNLDQRTVLLPALPQGQLWGLFRRSAVSLSITTHDGTPNTLLEAMACGSFPIAGDIESLREWIEPGVNGLLVDPGDPAGLAEAVLQALDHPDLRASAAEKNLALVAERAEASIVRRILDRFYQSLSGLR
jgi:glycosyltransferase involved in cell wall biosynthesis